MKQRVNIITLDVNDLEKSIELYRKELGWQTQGIVGTEFTVDDINNTLSKRRKRGAQIVWEVVQYEVSIGSATFTDLKDCLSVSLRILSSILSARHRKAFA